MAIQQHPIPQDISNYRFRLIGDMTIRQFASLGIFIILAIVIYGSPIPFFFRYPLAFIFLVTGIAMAFIPIQGRSLDVWIVAFIKSIYSPTQYVWKSTPEATTTDTPTSQETNTPVTPIVPLSTPMSSSNDTNTSTIKSGGPSVTPLQINQPTPVSTPTIETINPISETKEIKSDVKIPETAPISIEKSEPTPPISPSTIDDQQSTQTSSTPSPQPTIDDLQSTQPSAAPPSISLPVPFTPTTPNTIVGLSLTPDNHILDGVMIEIKKDNLTVRATRSNKLGQFLFARPLENGLYQILAEKEGFTFTPYALELTGEIIRPLKIQAT